MDENFHKIYKSDLNNSFRFEEKNAKKWIWFLFIAIFISSIVIVQKGIWHYQSTQKNIETFREHTKYMANLRTSYANYGDAGIFFLLVVTSLSSLSPAPSILGNANTGPSLSVFLDLKNDGMMTDFKGFMGFFIIIILVSALFLGIKAYENRERIRFYKSVCCIKALWAINLSRITIISFLICFFYLLAFTQCLINGVILDILPLISYCLILELAVISYILFGVLLDIYIPRIKIIGAVIYILLSLVIFPTLFNEVTHKRHNSLKIELENFDELIAFQAKLSKNFGKYKEGQIISDQKKIALELGVKNTFNIMRQNENNLFKKKEDQIKLKHMLHALLPANFIITCSRELSGGWDRSLLNFFKFVQKRKDQFVQYTLKKKYYEKNEKGIVEPFPESQVFQAKPMFPFYMPLGIIATILWNIALLLVARFGFINRMENKNNTFDGLDIPLKKGTLNCFLTQREDLKSFIIYSFKSNHQMISIDGKKGIDTSNFIYLPDPKSLSPGSEKLIDVQFDEDKEKWEQLLTAAFKKTNIVVTTWNLDTFGDIKIEKLKNIIDDKIYLNIGFNVKTWINDTQSSLCWKGDKDVQNLNPFKN